MSRPHNPLSGQEDKRNIKNISIIYGLSVLFFIIEIANVLYIKDIQNKLISHSIRLSTVGTFIDVQIIVNSIQTLLVLVIMLVVVDRLIGKTTSSGKFN